MKKVIEMSKSPQNSWKTGFLLKDFFPQWTDLVVPNKTEKLLS